MLKQLKNPNVPPRKARCSESSAKSGSYLDPKITQLRVMSIPSVHRQILHPDATDRRELESGVPFGSTHQLRVMSIPSVHRQILHPDATDRRPLIESGVALGSFFLLILVGRETESVFAESGIVQIFVFFENTENANISTMGDRYRHGEL
jgi:hypothetical protein